MARTLSTDDETLANAQVLLYRGGGAGVRYRVTVPSTDRAFHVDHDEDLADALAAMVAAGTVSAAQRTAFVAVAKALRDRARVQAGML